MKCLTSQFNYNNLYAERKPIKHFYINGKMFEMFIEEKPKDLYKHEFIKDKIIDERYKEYLVFD